MKSIRNLVHEEEQKEKDKLKPRHGLLDDFDQFPRYTPKNNAERTLFEGYDDYGIDRSFDRRHDESFGYERPLNEGGIDYSGIKIEQNISMDEIGQYADPDSPKYDYNKMLNEAETIALERLEQMAGQDLTDRYKIKTSVEEYDSYIQVYTELTLINKK